VTVVKPDRVPDGAIKEAIRTEIQFSSGQGSAECELAVAKLLDALTREFPDVKTLEKTEGCRPGCYRSARISGETDKKTALERLREALRLRDEEAANRAKEENWLEHTRIVRGNPVRVYRGPEFRLVARDE
jgi:protein subunit release factor B